MNKYWLNVKKANEPDLILWENLRVGKCARFFRILFIFLITFILVGATFYVAILAKNEETKFRQ